jgi:GNAT superfamily N-acetyltransferase
MSDYTIARVPTSYDFAAWLQRNNPPVEVMPGLNINTWREFWYDLKQHGVDPPEPNDETRWVVAMHEQKIVGASFVQLVQRCGLLGGLWVHPEHRGKGLWKRMLAERMVIASNDYIPFLIANPNKEHAERLKALGFTKFMDSPKLKYWSDSSLWGAVNPIYVRQVIGEMGPYDLALRWINEKLAEARA